MIVPLIARYAKLKGLHVVATADVLHKEWLEHLKKNLQEENSCYVDEEHNAYFIVSGEVQDVSRVHHIFFLPSLEHAEQLREKLRRYARMQGMGFARPIARLDAERIAEFVLDCEGIVGPAHAFTPYYSIFAHFNSLAACYGSFVNEISFIELGLSADSKLADKIAENNSRAFLTCSDAHSAMPHRLGREFTRIEMKKPSFEELKKVLTKDKERIKLNVGLDPREGKYHCTACNRCYEKYSLEDAIKLRWHCPKCSGTIKKGVRDRILELASEEARAPSFRPKYLHIIPLAEIIKIALNASNVNSTAVQNLWRELINAFGSEIAVLVDANIDELAELNENVAQKIEAFRQGYVLYIAGGGGNYGKPIICNSKEEFEQKQKELASVLDCNSAFLGQKTLADFF